MKYIVYTSAKCPHCKQVKKYLDGLGLTYEERNITDPNYRTEIFELGAMGVPVTLNTSTGNFVVGFNKTKLDELTLGVE